jgi:hypothetical protein
MKALSAACDEFFDMTYECWGAFLESTEERFEGPRRSLKSSSLLSQDVDHDLGIEAQLELKEVVRMDGLNPVLVGVLVGEVLEIEGDDQFCADSFGGCQDVPVALMVCHGGNQGSDLRRWGHSSIECLRHDTNEGVRVVFRETGDLDEAAPHFREDLFAPIQVVELCFRKPSGGCP